MLFSFLLVLYTRSCITIMFQCINLLVICAQDPLWQVPLSLLSLLPFIFLCFVTNMVKFPYLHLVLGKYLGFQRRADGLQNHWPEVVLGISWLLNG